MKRDDFMKDIQECENFGTFDQGLLDQAAAMFEKWGLLAHDPGLWAKTDSEHLFDDFGLNDKAGDNDAIKKQKKALRCISSKDNKDPNKQRGCSGDNEKLQQNKGTRL